MFAMLRNRLSGLVLLAALTLALLATGFGHRMPNAEAAALEAYALATGLPVDLCGDFDGDAKGMAQADCPVCHIVAVATPPAADLALRDADLILIATVVAPRENRAARMVRDPARGLRAPPVA